MLSTLKFDESQLFRANSFRCGDEPWEIEVADWIKAEAGKGGALDDVANGKCDVWLYLNETGDVVGFSSLGATKWKYPQNSSQRQQINVIPNVAIASDFQGRGHFRTVMEHLFAQAKKRSERLPLIGLFVDPRNSAAIDIYKRFGFETFHHDYYDPDTGVRYISMIAALPR